MILLTNSTVSCIIQMDDAFGNCTITQDTNGITQIPIGFKPVEIISAGFYFTITLVVIKYAT